MPKKKKPKYGTYSSKRWKTHRTGPNWTYDHAIILVNNRIMTPRSDHHRERLVDDVAKGMDYNFGPGHRIDKLMVVDGTAMGFKISKASYEGNWDSCRTSVWEFLVGCVKVNVRYSCHYTAVAVGDMMRVMRERESQVRGMHGMSVHLCMDEQERFFVVLCYNNEAVRTQNNNPALVFWK